MRDKTQIFRLFCHECQRVFHDRLINNQDKMYFNTIVCEMASKDYHKHSPRDSLFKNDSCTCYPLTFLTLPLCSCQANILVLAWSPPTLLHSPSYLEILLRSDSVFFEKDSLLYVNAVMHDKFPSCFLSHNIYVGGCRERRSFV